MTNKCRNGSASGTFKSADEGGAPGIQTGPGMKLHHCPQMDRPDIQFTANACVATHPCIVRHTTGAERPVTRNDVLALLRAQKTILTQLRFFGTQSYIEDLLGRPVDLVTNSALRQELRPCVEREAIHV